MAFGLIQKYPIDVTSSLRPVRAVGVSVPFNGDAVFNSTYTTQQQIKSNLINYFLTNKGERVFNPFFGSNLRSYLFEQLNNQTYTNLEYIIQTDLQQYFPSVFVDKLLIYGNEDNNILQVELYYSVKNFGINDQITLAI
jgi:phage baseplate assembly protein W